MKNKDRYHLASIAFNVLEQMPCLGYLVIDNGDDGGVGVGDRLRPHELLDPAARASVNDMIGSAAHYLDLLFRNGIPEEREPIEGHDDESDDDVDNEEDEVEA